MRNNRSTIAIWFWLATACTLHGQGTFQNLNFESANVDGFSPGNIPITNAFPGWTAYIGPTQVQTVGIDFVNIDAAVVFLESSLSPYYQPLQGNYSAFLQGSSIFATTASAAIAQTGQIPATAQSLIYIGIASGFVTFNGQSIPLSQIGAGPNYNIYGGNILALAGQTGELRFTIPPLGRMLIDNIQFSDQPIPEPSAFGLFGLGALLLGWRFQRKQHGAT